jgi:hypothetical protein
MARIVEGLRRKASEKIVSGEPRASLGGEGE